MIETLIYLVAALVTIGIPTIYIYREQRKSHAAKRTLAKAVQRGLDEPVSLHPMIDLNVCIGSASCVKACPEDEVIGIIDNRAALINPARCIGHGQCAAACPVEAISLVFGTETRGVDIPHIKGNFETNVPGIYIAGELGGMGLIRNAVTQGRQAAANIARSLPVDRNRQIYDLAIVGAGPAGIAAALQSKVERLNVITFEQEDLGGTILSYPRRKLVMTQPMELPIYGRINRREIQKEELLELFTDVFSRTGLKIHSNERVAEITPDGDGFVVKTTQAQYNAHRVLLAIGRRGSPRKLEVPGEKSAKVAYRLIEPEKFHHLNILVVGGGDSAVEAALALAEQPGNRVHISYRRNGFFRLKEGNLSGIERSVAAGLVILLMNSQVINIEPNLVHLEQGGRTVSIANDQIFVMIGGELPTEFLNRVGIQFTRKFGER